MTTLETIIPLVDWQGVEDRETRKGKLREVLEGIPLPEFRKVWKRTGAREREALRRVGFRFTFEVVPAGERQTTTGIPSKRRVKAPRRAFRKEWRVEVWINRKNAVELESAGLIARGGDGPF